MNLFFAHNLFLKPFFLNLKWERCHFQGLRVTLLMGSFGTALGSWIKVLGAAPDLFYVALIGQTITAMSQV